MDDLISRVAIKKRAIIMFGQLYVDVRDVDAAPAVDAAPVVHGRWVRKAKKVTCSHCGGFADWTSSGGWWEQIERPHCGHCGARMDLPEGEEATP